MIFLDLEALLYIAERTLGVAPAVRDHGLLESALARPQATAFGEDAYADIHERAAALLHSLVRNHALVDGNKRLGWVSVRLFYRLNEADLRASSNDAYDLVAAIADGSLRDVPEIAGRLRAWVVGSRAG